MVIFPIQMKILQSEDLTRAKVQDMAAPVIVMLMYSLRLKRLTSLLSETHIILYCQRATRSHGIPPIHGTNTKKSLRKSLCTSVTRHLRIHRVLRIFRYSRTDLSVTQTAKRQPFIFVTVLLRTITEKQVRQLSVQQPSL